jgi:hypothetical protein
MSVLTAAVLGWAFGCLCGFVGAVYLGKLVSRPEGPMLAEETPETIVKRGRS